MTTLADRGKAVPKARPFPDLARLIHPIDPETFEQEYWEQQPLLVQRNDPGYFADLLTLDDVDQALTLSGTKLDMLRVVVDGKETPVSALNAAYGHNALEALHEHYRNGSTVTLNALEQRWEPLQVFARRLGAELNARIQLNVYVTPAGNRGFVPHYDMHDVFIAQVHGA